MISKGKYQAHAIQVALGFTEKMSEQIGVLFELMECEEAGETITWYGYFSEKTADRTIESLRHCGWAGDDLSKLTAADLPDPVTLVVDEEMDQEGKLRAKVRWVNKLGAGTVAIKNVMDADAARAFGARFRAQCAAKPATAKLAPKPTQKPVQGPPKEFLENTPPPLDDLPF
jgi:hypothetical protein